MNNYEMAEKLSEEFPSFKMISHDGSVVSDKILYSCGAGWYELLRALFTEITQVYTEANKTLDVQFKQIKEKYGTLRIYYISKLPIDHLILKYRELSESVCERCGQPGSIREEGNEPWLLIRCDKCWEMGAK